MKEIKVGINEAGQRFDKLLFKYLNNASSSFIYKMLRKKNITLNNNKSDGKEKLKEGDVVKIFMSDETISKFRANNVAAVVKNIKLDIIFEDENIILVNKPSGMLSQKATSKDISLNEYIISYLFESGQLDQKKLETFRPSICNRLDRNTSGLVVAGKSLLGLQKMSHMFRERTMDKYYICIVNGIVVTPMRIKGFLSKDIKNNKVIITDNDSLSNVNNDDKSAQAIETEYYPIEAKNNMTLLKVKLITGRTHQIRAHLSSIGHGIIGDYKYGDKKVNDEMKKRYGLTDQLLHSSEIVFPEMETPFEDISKKSFKAEVPEIFKEIISKELMFKS